MATEHRSGTAAGPSKAKCSAGLEEGTGDSVLICLLRLDLRVTDNALFHFAHQTMGVPPTERSFNAYKFSGDENIYSQSRYLLPVYVFDEREIELSGLPGYKRKGPEARTREYAFWKTGGFRVRFISESVYDLRSRLRAAGSDLIIRFGRPEDVIENLVKGFHARGDTVEGVWMQKEMTSAEARVEEEIADRLRGTGVPLRFVHGKTLVHPSDLPFNISETPDVFTPFRKRVEALGPDMVRPTFPAPERFKPVPPSLPEGLPDYSLDVDYEIDVDGLGTNQPEKSEKTQTQVSYLDILYYLLRPLNESGRPSEGGGLAASVAAASTSSSHAHILQQRHPSSAFPFRGGESAALDRIAWYFIRGKLPDSSRWGRDDPPPVARYKQTRNNLVGHAYSTKMSPFLAYGSISPRQIWEALDYHERKFGEDQNTYWVRFELLWRDYFFFVAEKFGDLLFDVGGFEKATDPPQAAKKNEPEWWKTWDPSKDGQEHPITRLLEGRTGIPFIDANMLELRESGFMSNRGRQNVASFLSKDLGYDWRIGAEFFQSHLIDYDPTSNYGNWQYVAGVGNDPRASRQFNTIKQAKDYDSHGEYVRTWIPALRSLPGDHVHTPWLLTTEERWRCGLKSTKSEVSLTAYPEKPIIELEGWNKHYERREGMGSKMHGNPQEKVKDGKARKMKRSIAPLGNVQARNVPANAPIGAKPSRFIGGGALSFGGPRSGAEPGVNQSSPGLSSFEAGREGRGPRPSRSIGGGGWRNGSDPDNSYSTAGRTGSSSPALPRGIPVTADQPRRSSPATGPPGFTTSGAFRTAHLGSAGFSGAFGSGTTTGSSVSGSSSSGPASISGSSGHNDGAGYHHAHHFPRASPSGTPHPVGGHLNSSKAGSANGNGSGAASKADTASNWRQ